MKNKKSDSSKIYQIFSFLGLITGSSMAYLFLMPVFLDVDNLMSHKIMNVLVLLLPIGLLLVTNLVVSFLVVGFISIVLESIFDRPTIVIFSTLGIVFNLIILDVFMGVFGVGWYKQENELRVVAKPLEKQLFTFLQKNKITPSILQSAAIIKNSGCEKIVIYNSKHDQKFICMDAGKQISIEYVLDSSGPRNLVPRKNLHSSVYMKLRGSSCFFGYDDTGKPRRFETDKKLVSKIKCRTSGTLKLSH